MSQPPPPSSPEPQGPGKPEEFPAQQPDEQRAGAPEEATPPEEGPRLTKGEPGQQPSGAGDAVAPQPPAPPQQAPAAPDAGSAAPAGGFGPPVTPPPPPQAPPAQPAYGQPGQPPAQPGYGFPQQPPAQPGYGYPQQPPAQPGYGYPQQPPPGQGFGAPGPYGAPTAPHPQYGWTPPPGADATGKPSSGSRGPVVVLVIAAVLALLLAGGGAVWFFAAQDSGPSAGGSTDGGGDGDGDGTDEGGEGGEDVAGLPDEAIEAEVAWQVASPEATEEDILVYAQGFWLTDDAMVRMMKDEIVSYSLADGEEQWSTPVETQEGRCNATRTASEGRIALLQGRDCEHLTVLDITTGEEVWTLPVSSGSTTPGRYDHPVILGDTVVIGWTAGIHGFSISEEKQIWAPQQGETCQEVGFAVFDEVLLSELSCGFLGDKGVSIRATEEDGTELWEWEVPQEWDGEEVEFRSVLSLDPFVVQLRLGEGFGEAEEHLFVADAEQNRIVHQLPFDDDRHVLPCEAVSMSECPGAVVLDDMLYLASRMSGDNAVVAFDLTTGQAVWEADPINGGQIMPFGTLDGKVLAYQLAGYEVAGMVVAIDPETERAEPVMALEHTARETERTILNNTYTFDARLLWHNNTFFMIDEAFYPHDGEDDPALLVYR